MNQSTANPRDFNWIASADLFNTTGKAVQPYLSLPYFNNSALPETISARWSIR